MSLDRYLPISATPSRVLVLGALLSATLVACASRPKLTDHLAEHHLTVSAEAPDYIDEAITRANSLLATRETGRLQWHRATDAQVQRSGSIPVFCIDGANAPMAFVPVDHRAILLHSRTKRGFVGRYATERKSMGYMDVPIKVGEPEDLVALILLHEAGHIALGSV